MALAGLNPPDAMRSTTASALLARVVGALLLAGWWGRTDAADEDRPGAGRPPGGWQAREVNDPFEGTTGFAPKPTALALRVVDQQGRGLPGARIYSVGEARHPLPRLVNEKEDLVYGPTDEWGRLRVEEPQVSWDHMLVLADGYAPSNEWRTEGSDTVCRLARGEDLAVTVRDPLDRPVANVLVGYRLHCGHTPDVRQARTDAQGHAVLPRIDRRDTKWLWPVGESIASEDFAVADGYPFSRRGIVLRPDWGAVCEGVVFDANGAPVAGAAVGGRGWHRGPWTFTDAGGAFRLLGFAPFERVHVDPDDDTFGGETSTTIVACPGLPVRVRLPAKDGRSTEPHEPEILVRVRSADPTRPLRELDEVLAWRKEDGRGGSYGRGENGSLDLPLAAGTWVVRVEGRPETGGSGEAVVVVSGTTEVAVPRETLRTLRVDASALGPNDEVRLHLPGRTVDVTRDVTRGAIVLPTVGEALLRVSRADRVRSVRVPALVGADAAPLPLRPPDSTTITARLRGPDGSEVKAGVRLEAWLPTSLGEEGDDGEEDGAEDGGRDPVPPSLATEAVGLTWFVARPMDAKLGGVAVEVDLGAGEVHTIDLGELRLPERSSLVVSIEPPAGVAAEDTVVQGVVPDIDWRWLTTAAAEEPSRLPFALPVGSVLVGGAPHRLPVRVAADGRGPYRVAWPKGALEVVVPSAEGGILGAVQVLVDGDRFEAGPVRNVVFVGGIPAGEHRVLVCAPGRKAREYRATWTEGETKWLSADLPPR